MNNFGLSECDRVKKEGKNGRAAAPGGVPSTSKKLFPRNVKHSYLNT